MHRELVDQKKWVSESQFLNALNYCMFLPGPEAQQTATYIGWLLHGVRGGIVAGTLFILPGAVMLSALAWLYIHSTSLGWFTAALAGVKPAILTIVSVAIYRIGSRTLKSKWLWGLAALGLFATATKAIPFPFIILASILIGGILPQPQPELAACSPEEPATHITTSLKPKRDLLIALIGLSLWLAPAVAAHFSLGHHHTVTEQGLLFGKTAVVTFGGAYAVLPYVTQTAIEQHHWMTAGQMLDGLGLAEAKPGPLILVLQFVGFLGAWNQPGSLSPAFAATLGMCMAIWMTFIPGFLLVLLGAPYFERVRQVGRLQNALKGVTAAVVGVMSALGLWLAMQVLLTVNQGFEWRNALIVVITAGVFRWQPQATWLAILVAATLGLLLHGGIS